MNKTWIAPLICVLPVFAFGQNHLAKITEATLIEGGETTLKGAAVSSALGEGIRMGVLQPVAPIAPQVDLTREVSAVALKSASVQPPLPPLAQRISYAVSTAKIANHILFNTRKPTQFAYAMDAYPAKIMEKAQQTAREGAVLPTPLTMDEVNILLVADTEGKFFDPDYMRHDGLVITSFRQPIHINVNPGSFMRTANKKEVWKIEEEQFQRLQQTLKANWTPQAIDLLKQRADIFHYTRSKSYLTYDEFRALIAAGDTDFFSDPFLALLRRERWDDSVGVFLQLKKNIVVSSNFSLYALPANSYVCILNQPYGDLRGAQFVFDAGENIRPFTPEMTKRLREKVFPVLPDSQVKLNFLSEIH